MSYGLSKIYMCLNTMLINVISNCTLRNKTSSMPLLRTGCSCNLIKRIDVDYISKLLNQRCTNMYFQLDTSNTPTLLLINYAFNVMFHLTSSRMFRYRGPNIPDPIYGSAHYLLRNRKALQLLRNIPLSAPGCLPDSVDSTG